MRARARPCATSPNMDLMRHDGNRIMSLEATKETLAWKPLQKLPVSQMPDPNTPRVFTDRLVQSLSDFFMVSAVDRVTQLRLEVFPLFFF